jgi:hypothetical protein
VAVERVQIQTNGGNGAAKTAIVVGLVGLAAVPVALVAADYSGVVTRHVAIAIGGAAGSLLGILTLLLARHGRLRAAGSIAAQGSGAARTGRLLGALAFCVGIAAGIALATDALLTHFQK